MPPAMHDVLAHAYHLGLRILLIPGWRSPVAAFAVALLVRLTLPGSAALGAALALLAGWLALVLPGPILLSSPVERFPGLAILLAAYVLAAPRLGRLAIPVCALLAAWWLRGAPLGAAGLASIVPVCLGLFAAMAITRRIAASDTGWATIAASLALALLLPLTGGAMHWARAAVVPACAGIALIGTADAVAILQLGIVLTAAAAVVASDRGRFIPVDAAALAPLLVWFLAPRLLPRLNRAGPAFAAILSAVAGVGLIWGAAVLFAQR
jgi:hypothetical protein